MNKHPPAMRRPLRAVHGRGDGDDGGSDADGVDDGRLDGGDGADGAVGQMVDGLVMFVVADRVDVTVVDLVEENDGHLPRRIAGGDGVTPDYGTALVLRVQRLRDGRKPQRQLQLLQHCVQRGLKLADGLGG